MKISKSEVVQFIVMLSLLLATMSIMKYADSVHHSGNFPQVETFRGE